MLKKSLVYLVVLGLLTGVSLVTVSDAAAADVLPTPSRPIPDSYFGMHIHRGISPGRWPSVRFHGWRLWSAFCAWPDLEPSKGDWRFETLDGYVAQAERNGVEVMLLLGLSPAWASARPTEPSIFGTPGWAAEPADIEDWRNYVRTVATRYKGRIRYYEMWNEPNLTGFYSGSVRQMLTLAREAHAILKQVDPSIVLVSPAPTAGNNGPAWLEEYFALGGARYADVIGYHLYVTPDPPEKMVALAERVRSIMRKHDVEKALWNTEAGWDKRKKFADEEEQGAFVARSFILNWAAGVERFYWYAWDNKDWVSLRMTNDSYRPTFAASAYTEVRQWLAGARMSSCQSDARGIWSCKISRDAGYQAWIVWSDSGRQLSIPKSWGVRRAKDLSGKRRELAGASHIEVGPSPLLLEK